MIDTAEVAIPVDGIDGSRLHVDGKVYEKASFSSSRRNFVWNKYIIKAGRQSEQEALFFDSIKEEDRKYFVPIVSRGKALNLNSAPPICKCCKEGTSVFWVAQPYLHFVKQHPLDQEELITEKFQELEDVIKKYRIADVWMERFSGEVCIYNWAIINDTPVCYDYGIAEF